MPSSPTTERRIGPAPPSAGHPGFTTLPPTAPTPCPSTTLRAILRSECIDGIDEMLRAAKPYNFDIIDMASPLGPNWDEAIDVICQEIIPRNRTAFAVV